MAKDRVEKVSGYEPLGSRVIVRRLDWGDKTESGLLHLPEVAQEWRRVAEVVAVGPGRITEHGVLIEPRIKPGDIVLTVRHKGTPIEVGENEERETLQILDESDCMIKVTL